MSSVVALGALTGGINLHVSDGELRELGLTPGSYVEISAERMEAIRLALEKRHGPLPEPNSGGSVANTADLLARAGVSCGFMGVGGDDPFGRVFAANFARASLVFLSELRSGAVTGYDFYLYSQDGVRTIVLTHGANALLSPAWIDGAAIRQAKLLLLDGGALDFGPESAAAIAQCVQIAENEGVPFVLTLASTEVVARQRAFFKTYGPKAQMVAGNLEQTAVLLDLEPAASLDEVSVALAESPFDALVTLDAAGAYARSGDEAFFQPTQKIATVDTTGAGDNFLAAYLIARLRGLSVPRALAVGNMVAGQVVQYEGARLPLRLNIPDLLHAAIQVAKNIDD